MRRLILALAVLVLASPSVAATVKAPAPKTAAKPAAAGTTVMPKIPNFDARNPASISALIEILGAKATIPKSEKGMVFINASTPTGGFGVQMIGCDAKGQACHAMAMYAAYEKKGVTLVQINDFNRAQLACRGVMAPEDRPSVMYSTLVNQRMTQEEAFQAMGVWQGCLLGFGEFTKDPAVFLSKPHN